MRGHERSPENFVTAEFEMPPVVEHKEWKYFGARFKITNTADAFLVRHMMGMVRH